MRHLTMIGVLAFAAASSQAESWDILSGAGSGVKDEQMETVRSLKQWDALWARHRGPDDTILPPPVDFAGDSGPKEMVVAVWGDAAASQVSIAPEPDPSNPSRLMVFYRQTPTEAPGAAGRPFAMRKVPAYSEVVYVPLGSIAESFAKSQQNKDGAWALIFRFGPTFSDYSSTDIRLKTSRVDATIADAQIGERNSMEYYKPSTWGAHPFHFIDEPSNDFTLSAENRKKGFAINLIARHPKFLVVEGNSLNQNVGVKGTIDGQAVDGKVNLSDTFDHYRLTKGLMNFQLQFEKLFSLTGKAGRLTYAPGVSAGIYTGSSNASYRGQTADVVSNYGLVGKGISLSNRLTWEIGRFSATAMHQLTKAWLDYHVLGGSAAQNLDNHTVTVQLGVTLHK